MIYLGDATRCTLGSNGMKRDEQEGVLALEEWENGECYLGVEEAATFGVYAELSEIKRESLSN